MISVVFLPEQIKKIFDSFFDPANPIYISILITAFIFGIIFFFYKYIINPITERFNKEKESLELKTAKLMALFAELDPDPVIRIDSNGSIVVTNDAAQKVFSSRSLIGENIAQILPMIDYKKNGAFVNTTKVFTKKINKRYYSVLYRSEPKLNIGQIYMRDITDLKTYEERLLESQVKLKELSEHLQELIEEERQKIASGLHDGIGQSLSLLRIKLLKMKEQNNINSQFQNYADLIESLKSIINELKEISYSLKPKTLEEMGLGIALKTLADKVSVETGIEAEVTAVGEKTRLNSKLEIYLYRIAQEALNNIIKHSKASRFGIQLVISNKYIRLIISDNGIGFDTENILTNKFKLGMGLINMRERVETFNGKFKIDSAPDKGTMLVAELPLTKKKL